MKKLLIVLAVLAFAGCCENPNAIKQVMAGYHQAQALAYGADGQLMPNVKAALNNPKVREGVTAVDLVLATGGAVRDSYCASQQQVAQVNAAAATAAANLPK